MTFVRRALSFAAYIIRRALFPVFERVLPAHDGLWCFCTWERHYHTLDNPRAVLEAVGGDSTITAVVLQKTDSGMERHPTTPGVLFVKAESLRGVYYLARSRVVILGFALSGLSSYAHGITRKHIVVQLWHGIPLRRIGRLFPRETWWAAETPKYAAMFASSERERANLAAAFSPLTEDRIPVTGLPRNEFILGAESALPPDYGTHLNEVRDSLRGRRLVLYAPTWRDTEENHYQFSKDETRRLSELLRRNNAVLGIRGHPNVQHLARFSEDSGFAEILNMSHYPDVNVVIRETAVLISDYSSIYLDFLLTNRPVLHFAYDHDAYLASRIGFLYEVDEIFAGPVCRTFDDLLSSLAVTLESGVADTEAYDQVRERFHRHENNSAEAVANYIRELAVKRRSNRDL